MAHIARDRLEVEHRIEDYGHNRTKSVCFGALRIYARLKMLQKEKI